MTDRELLELASKAAGYIVQEHVACDAWAYGAWVYEAGSAVDQDGEPKLFLWRPRDDDGDALRLAVKLRMFRIGEVWVIERTSIAEWERDPYAATRHAITRAAAEIGRNMP
jgi:hypothetical protein